MERTVDIEAVDPLAWENAQRWFAALSPYLHRASIPDIAAKSLAYDLGCCRATVYNKFKALKTGGRTSSLLPSLSGPAKGSTYLSDRVEKHISTAIQKVYKTQEKPTAHDTWEYACVLCFEDKIKEPSIRTVQRRINALGIKEKITSREGQKAYNSKRSKGSKKLVADHPLQIVQIDHTPTDLMVVDRVTRQSIGRPWLTALIDVYSRMILGYHFDLRSPSTWSVSEALHLAVFPKDAWLKENKIDKQWPTYGLFEKLMTDGAQEFTSKAMEIGCAEYGIVLDQTTGGPNLRGHIERVFGTFKNKFHSIPGTTFSNIQQRGNYNSDDKAIFTLKELNHFFGIYLLGRYHETRHSGLNAAPIDVWNDAIKSGFNPRVCTQEPTKFRMDFISSKTPSITNKGIRYKNNYFWNEVVQSMYEMGVKSVKIYPFHNDITRLMIRDSQNSTYVIPNSNFSLKQISWAEHDAMQKLDKRFENSGLTMEARVEQVHLERHLIEKASKLTRAARKKNEIDEIEEGRSSCEIEDGPLIISNEQLRDEAPLKFKPLKVIGGDNE